MGLRWSSDIAGAIDAGSATVFSGASMIVLRYIKAHYPVFDDSFVPDIDWEPPYVKVFGGSNSRFRK